MPATHAAPPGPSPESDPSHTIVCDGLSKRVLEDLEQLLAPLHEQLVYTDKDLANAVLYLWTKIRDRIPHSDPRTPANSEASLDGKACSPDISCPQPISSSTIQMHGLLRQPENGLADSGKVPESPDCATWEWGCGEDIYDVESYTGLKYRVDESWSDKTLERFKPEQPPTVGGQGKSPRAKFEGLESPESQHLDGEDEGLRRSGREQRKRHFDEIN